MHSDQTFMGMSLCEITIFCLINNYMAYDSIKSKFFEEISFKNYSRFESKK